MSGSERAELGDLIHRIYTEMGGRATKPEVQAHLEVILPRHLRDYLMRTGLSAIVGGYFRKKGADGLPQAPDVGSGVHVQLGLLEEEDYRFLVRSYMNRADANAEANTQKARSAARQCKEIYGVEIDIYDPYGEAAAS